MRGFSWGLLCTLIFYNSYIYFAANYMNGKKLYVYCYILPSVYIVCVCLFISSYELFSYKQEKINAMTKKQGLIDTFSKLLLPLYTILPCLQNGYCDVWYRKTVVILKIPLKYQNFAIGMLFTLLGFCYSVFFAFLLYTIIICPLNHKLDVCMRKYIIA